MTSLKQKTLSNMIWKFSERILAQVITLLVTIVLARILMPEDYGAVAIISAVINICNIFVIKGFGNALVQKKDADQLDFSTVFFIYLGLASLVYLLLVLVAPVIAEFYNLPILSSLLVVMGLRIPFASLNSIQHAYVSRRLEFKKYFLSTLSGAILSAIVGISMAYSGYGPWALVGQYLTHTIVDTMFLWFTVQWRPTFQFSFSRAKSLFSYGWKLLVASVFDQVCKEIQSFAIGKSYTPADLAYYTKANQFPNLAYTNIDATISSVLFPVMAKSQDDLKIVKRYMHISISVTSFFVFPILIGFIAAADTFTVVLLTEKWLPIVPYMRILCIGYLFTTLLTTNLQALKAIGRSDVYLRFNIIKNISTVLMLFVTITISVKAVSIGVALLSVLFLLVNTYHNNKIFSYGLREQLKDIFPCIFISSVMGVVVYFVGYIQLSSSAILFIQILIGILIYITLSSLFKVYGWIYFINLIKERLGR